MRRRRLTAAAVVLTTALVAGCGPLGGESDEDKVRDAVTDFVTASQERDYATVCDLLSADQLEALGEEDCEATLEEQANPLSEDIELRIDQVRVDGERATVDATFRRPGEGSEPASFLLVSEGGEWKVGSAAL